MMFSIILRVPAVATITTTKATTTEAITMSTTTTAAVMTAPPAVASITTTEAITMATIIGAAVTTAPPAVATIMTTEATTTVEAITMSTTIAQQKQQQQQLTLLQSLGLNFALFIRGKQKGLVFMQLAKLPITTNHLIIFILYQLCTNAYYFFILLHILIIFKLRFN